MGQRSKFITLVTHLWQPPESACKLDLETDIQFLCVFSFRKLSAHHCVTQSPRRSTCQCRCGKTLLKFLPSSPDIISNAHWRWRCLLERLKNDKMVAWQLCPWYLNLLRYNKIILYCPGFACVRARTNECMFACKIADERQHTHTISLTPSVCVCVCERERERDRERQRESVLSLTHARTQAENTCARERTHLHVQNRHNRMLKYDTNIFNTSLTLKKKCTVSVILLVNTNNRFFTTFQWLLTKPFQFCLILIY